MVVAALLALSLAQIDMAPQLQRGPLVLVEEGKGGKFGQATAIVLIDAPPEKVWDMLVKMDDQKSWMPKVLTSDITRKGPKDFDIHFVLDVPGPDTDYVIRYTPDAKNRSLDGSWMSGDLKGSHWYWRVEEAPGGKTLLYHSISVKNFSAFAQSFEDDAQTITVGLNVSSVLTGAKGLKKHCEAPPAPAATATSGK